jgi:hypothetical protein
VTQLTIGGTMEPIYPMLTGVPLFAINPIQHYLGWRGTTSVHWFCGQHIKKRSNQGKVYQTLRRGSPFCHPVWKEQQKGTGRLLKVTAVGWFRQLVMSERAMILRVRRERLSERLAWMRMQIILQLITEYIPNR